jgi:hypothetical protein
LVDLLLAHFDHELVVALVGAVFPLALGLDDHAHAVAGLERGDGLHRRAEVGHVQLAAQAFGQRGLEEFDHQLLALLADVDADLVVRQFDHHAAGRIRSAAEVEVLDRLRVAGAVFGELRRRGGGGPARRPHRVQRHQQRLALQLRLVAGGRLQVEHQPRAVTGGDHVDRAQVALVQFDRRAAQAVAGAGDVQRDARGGLDGEAGRHRVQRLREVDAHDLHATLQRAADRFHERCSAHAPTG